MVFPMLSSTSVGNQLVLFNKGIHYKVAVLFLSCFYAAIVINHSWNYLSEYWNHVIDLLLGEKTTEKMNTYELRKM